VERSSWRQVAVELADDAAWIRRVATEIADRIHREIPRLGTDTELAEATRESVADNIWLFVSMVVAEVPPERAAPRTLAHEYVRLLVRRGIGPEVIAATYRTATQAFWQPWTERLRARLPEDRLAAALDESTQYILGFINALSDQVVELYAAERKTWVRSADAVRADTIRALLDAGPVDAVSAERRLGYALGRMHRCVLAWTDNADGESATGEVRVAATSLIEQLGGTEGLWFEPNRTTVAGWTVVPPRAPRNPALTAPAGVWTALGTAQPGLDGFRQTYQDAMHARRVAILRDLAAGTLVSYDEVALQALASADLEQARRFVVRHLGPLARDDDLHRELAATLREFLTHESNLRATAAAIGIHHNTVANRLRRAAELLEEPIAGRSAEVLVALELLPVTRR
jgi:DNA-binding PucR family transcriptional regulator